MLTRRIWGPVGASDDLQARYGSDLVTISAVALGGDRVDASDKTAAEAKGLGWISGPAFSMPSMRTLRWAFVGAATERARARVYVSPDSTRGATATFSHRSMAALGSLPAE
jgi:hypothetical protein